MDKATPMSRNLFGRRSYEGKHHVLPRNCADDRGGPGTGLPDPGMVPGEEGGGR